MVGVMRYCNMLKVGISWKGPEVIELWSRCNSGGAYYYDSDAADSDCSLLVGVSSSSAGFTSDESEEDDEDVEYGSAFVWHIQCYRG